MKKQTKHEKIIALYKEGTKPKDIAAKLKINVKQVYAAKHLESKKSAQKRQELLSGGIMRVIQPQVKRYNTEQTITTDKILDMIKCEQGSIIYVPDIKKSLFQKIKEFLSVRNGI